MVEVILIGVVAGVLAGMLGIGGGALFVPALVAIVGLSQVDAEATSLLAIVPVAAVGAWRQHAYGNLRVKEGLIVGGLAIPGAVGGVALVNALPERVVEVAFACLQLFVAAQLIRRALRTPVAAPD
ncbi:sulfite exporter TauE/SafE family protein [Paraconexibacter sp. AEG42_29]|uniref:sulfite exporter TauE/SafE family protein n=1 Tax=Paraconexibacter sp. AEG42_29 TaxID=2997339 RepID=UPI00339D501E